MGIGTLYRHFPTREALVEAANRAEIAKICAQAPGLLKRHPPDEALRRFLGLFLTHMRTKQGMVEAVKALVAADRAPLNASLQMVREAVAPIIAAGKAQGVVRKDFRVEDFIAIKGALAFAGPEKGRRLVALFLDGLRPVRRSRARGP